METFAYGNAQLFCIDATLMEVFVHDNAQLFCINKGIMEICIDGALNYFAPMQAHFIGGTPNYFVSIQAL